MQVHAHAMNTCQRWTENILQIAISAILSPSSSCKRILRHTLVHYHETMHIFSGSFGALHNWMNVEDSLLPYLGPLVLWLATLFIVGVELAEITLA